MIRRAFILLASAGMSAAAWAAETWHVDLEVARALAIKERKELLVEFTGSDWSPGCIALRKQVFDSDDFARFARRFVLVRVDFPRKTRLPEEAANRNASVAATFAVAAYPTVLLLDAKSGEVFGRIAGYNGSAAAVYLAELSAFQNTETARLSLREAERMRVMQHDEIVRNERMIEETIKNRDFPGAVAVIDEIYRGLKGPRRAIGTLNKAILSHRIDPAALDRTWSLLRQALLEAEDDADIAKPVVELARRIAPDRKLEKAKPAPKDKPEKGA